MQSRFEALPATLALVTLGIFALPGCDVLDGLGGGRDRLGAARPRQDSGAAGQGGFGGYDAGSTGGTGESRPGRPSLPDVPRVVVNPPADAAADAAVDEACPEGPRGMVRLRGPDGTSFCMDARRVTEGEYFAFTSSGPTLPGTDDPLCVGNASFNPEWNPDDGIHGWSPDSPDSDIGLDWCDARAYCAWEGKRLCAGAGGRPLRFEVRPAEVIDEYYLACSQFGARTYAWGNQARDCSAPGDPLCSPQNPPFSRVEGLGSYISEWTDVCTQEHCQIHIGSEPCAQGAFVVPGDPGNGLRCCW